MSFNIFLLFIACCYKMHLAEFIATTLIPTPLEVHSRDARYRCMFNARQSIYLVYIILSVLKFENGTKRCTSPIFFLKWGASSRWSLRPNSAWNSKVTTTIGKTHPTLERILILARVIIKNSTFTII